MKKKIVFRCLVGAPIGVTVSLCITVIFSLCTGHGTYFPAPHELIDGCGGNAIAAVTVQMLGALAVGAVCGGSSAIWETEKWSLLKQTLVHFAVIGVPFFGVGYALHWLPHHLYGALGYIGGFVAVYAIMWCALYFSVKSKIKKMNRQLRELRRENGEETPKVE